jgi:hypothetical protein
MCCEGSTRSDSTLDLWMKEPHNSLQVNNFQWYNFDQETDDMKQKLEKNIKSL